MNLLATFLEGLLSFLSPCVLPLIPLYMAYLSGDAAIKDEEGNIHYNQWIVFIRTFFFVFGILTAIFLMAISVDVIRDYIADYQDIIAIAGSVLIFIFGLHETGVIEINVLNREFSFKKHLNLSGMNIIKAFVFGFLFTFAWSPCIGPMLSSALLLSLSEEAGILYLIVYGLGFVIPFIICGLFTGTILNLIKKYKKVGKAVGIISGIILMGFSVYMFVNASENIISYKNVPAETTVETETSETATDETDISEKTEETEIHYVPDTVYYDQDGNEVSLQDYEGKYLFINYMATWCTYCVAELPDLQSFSNTEDVACLIVMSVSDNESKEKIKEFHDEQGIELPIVIDEDNSIMNYFGVSSYPVSWVIGPDSSILGYHLGALDEEGFNYILTEAKKIFEERNEAE